MAIFCGIVQFFRSYFFWPKSCQKNAENLSHIFFLHIVACFCSFLFHRVISGVFFRVIKSFWLLLCVFFDGKLVLENSSRVHFFLVAQKSEHISFVCFCFLVVFSTIFSMHTCKYASKNLKRVNFVFFAVFVQIKGK
jgi:hypothetical protein